MDESPFLGDFVGRKGIRMDPVKVKIIVEWYVPRTKKTNGRFYGGYSLYAKILLGLAQFAGPFHDRIKVKHPR